MRLFLAMQVRVMAACMESQTDILEYTASAQSGRREVTVCFSPMSMDVYKRCCTNHQHFFALFLNGAAPTINICYIFLEPKK